MIIFINAEDKVIGGRTQMTKIQTPCKNICDLDEKLYICKTCKRTEDEIASWLDYTPSERKAVMKRIKERNGHSK